MNFPSSWFVTTSRMFVCGLLAVISLLSDPGITVTRAATPETNTLFVRVVDVGPGLCSVIKFPNGKFMIYDAGWTTHANSKIAELIPFGSDIELLVLSHSDADHLSSVPFICTNYHVKKVLRSGMTRTTATWKAMRKAISAEVASDQCEDINLHFQPQFPGKTFQYGDVRAIFVFGLDRARPHWGFTKTTHTSEYYNSGSIVIRLEYNNRAILFCGDTVGRLAGDPSDTCIAAEKEMVDNITAVALRSQVIIAPHHGGDNGSSLPFIRAIQPDFVIFSAGHKHGHPRAVAAQRFLSEHVATSNMFRTDFRDDEKGSMGNKEWKHGRTLNHSDPARDDDVDIVIRPTGAPKVSYRNN